MDALAFRLGNRLLGNADELRRRSARAHGHRTDAEIRLRCADRTRAARAGAPRLDGDVGAEVSGACVPVGAVAAASRSSAPKYSMPAPASAHTSIYAAASTYRAYHGRSRATFTLGQFGGHAGRTLRSGDVLRIHADASQARADGGGAHPHGASVPPGLRPSYANDWNIAVLYGPQGAPDFFDQRGHRYVLATDRGRCTNNSSRTGVRLIGPQAAMGAAAMAARPVCIHRNIHDNAYRDRRYRLSPATCSVIPRSGWPESLGGFLSARPRSQLADLWKLGQLRPVIVRLYALSRLRTGPRCQCWRRMRRYAR